MSQTTALFPHQQSHVGLHLRVFSPALKSLWAMVVIITVAIEVVPIPLMRPTTFYAYCAAKLICFLTMGYLAPLAFCGFTFLNRGLLLATISATCVESLQALLRGGHSFHWYELIIKLGLIMIGFAMSLDARYNREISIGPLHVRLTSEYLPESDGL